jgi:uncharacterized repeat protein (TIGR03803 family)
MRHTRPDPRWIQFSAATVFALLVITSFAVAQNERILHRFGAASGGTYPSTGLIADSAGNLYGVTLGGGAYGDGAVFQLTPPSAEGGAWTETILHHFGASTDDGISPRGPLTFDTAGNLFGTTASGGDGDGSVFELSPPSTTGGTWTYTQLASFSNATVTKFPSSKLIFDKAGNLYGTSYGGRVENSPSCGGYCGNVFEMQPPSVLGGSWTLTSIYDFLSSGRPDGIFPNGLILGDGGAVYGTTAEGGGTSSVGTFFKLAPPDVSGGAWTEKVLYTFNNATGNPIEPNALELHLGKFLGTSSLGGTSGFGSVFQMIQTSPENWFASVLYSFSGGSDGAYPANGGVASDAAGNL